MSRGPLVVCVSVVLVVTAASACARSTGEDSDFAPVVDRAPAGISARLIVDSTVSVAPSPDVPAAIGARSGSCAYALRDPASGVRFMLAGSMQVDTRIDTGSTGSTSASRAEANYLPGPQENYRLPPDRFLRVRCGTHEVVGLAKALQRGG